MQTMQLHLLTDAFSFLYIELPWKFNDCAGSRVKPENTDIHAIAWNSREYAEMGLHSLMSVTKMNSKCFSTLTPVRYSEFVDLFLVIIEPILRNEQTIKIKQLSSFVWSILFSRNSDTRLKGHISSGIKNVDFHEEYLLFTTIAQQKNS